MSSPPDLSSLIARFLTALTDADAALSAEQSPAGIDALDELQLHPILASAITAADLGLAREQPYPSDDDPRLHPRDRERCDLVIYDDPNHPLIDPRADLKELDAAADSLFLDHLQSDLADQPGTPPEDALWIEVKSVAQHLSTGATPGPNRNYAKSLVAGAKADLLKLSLDPRIHHAASLTILFAESEDIIQHDALQLAHACLDAGLAIAEPLIECAPIADRCGNAAVGLVALPPKLH